MKAKILGIVIAASALLVGDFSDPYFGRVLQLGSFTNDAEARVGRPITPGSVAGVARRTTRRVVRHSTIYVATLPTGCVVYPVDGVNYWKCGVTYYGTHSGQYVVVYFD